MDLIERIRKNTLIIQATLTFIGLIISLALLLNIIDFLALDKYSGLYVVSRVQEYNPINPMQHFGMKFDDDYVLKLEDYLNHNNGLTEVLRIYPMMTRFYVKGPSGEFRGNYFAQMDESLLEYLHFRKLKYEQTLLNTETKRLIVSQGFADEIFGSQDIIGQKLSVKLADELDYEAFIICGIYDSSIGNSRSYDGSFDLIALDPISGIDYRPQGVILARSNLGINELGREMNQFFSQENVENVFLTSYKDHYRDSATYINSFSGVMMIGIFGIFSLLLAIFGSILSIGSKLAEGHFHVSIYKVLGVNRKAVLSEMLTWIFKVYGIAFLISMIIVPFFLPAVHDSQINLLNELTGMEFAWKWMFYAAGLSLAIIFGTLLLICVYKTYKAWKMDCIDVFRSGI